MTFGPFQFDQPIWLLLIPVGWALTWLIARRSIAGTGDVTRRVAIGVRWLVIVLIAGAMARPSWRRETEDLSVIVVADRSRSMPPGSGEALDTFLTSAAEGARTDDRLGIVTVARDAAAQALASERRTPAIAIEEAPAAEWHVGEGDATNLAAGIRLGMSIKPEETAGRLLLFSDGNETTDSVLAAASAAKAAGVPIDVLLMPFRFDREVIFENLVAPATARRGQVVNLRFVLTSTKATKGDLTLLSGGQPLDLSPDTPGPGLPISLDPGTNVITLPVTLDRSGPQTFEAVFTPANVADDNIPQNNRALAVTFVSGEGRTLVAVDDTAAAAPLVQALRESRIEVDVRQSADLFQSLVDLQAFESVVLFDIPASAFSYRQQQELRSYVHDSGGGLIMVGGPNSFGAGGWIDTPVADAIPVLMDPPQKRQMPRGALVLVMHSCEMPQGNYWGQQTALAAAGALSRLDLIGVVEYSWGAAAASGVAWPYPLAEKGDGVAVTRAINNLVFGDMPDFQSILQSAYAALRDVKAGQKHCIVISDGDPQPPSSALLKSFVSEGITISTVEIFPHGAAYRNIMLDMARLTGGEHYMINSQAQLQTLPQIFVKEAQIVKRSLIFESDPYQPSVVDPTSEPLRGLTRGLPAMTGHVVTADREGLSLVTVRGPENDPIVAQWQYGLGRAIAFTSDAAARWDASWLGWSGYRQFWDQHVRWAMRPGGSADMSVVTSSQGARTHVVVTALDEKGDTLNFARFEGRATAPDLSSIPVELHQTGPGRYEGDFDSDQSGSYIVNMRYEAARPDGTVDRGSVQAAVTRPFADEYRALKDNTPLLRQVAELTGGRVLDVSQGSDSGLFDRAGLSMPVTFKPIWLVIIVIGIGAFLVDVGVRRVRIDIPGAVRAIRRAFLDRARQREAKTESLRLAREKARERISEQAAPSEQAPTASRKFEAAAGAPMAPPPVTGAPGPAEGSKTAARKQASEEPPEEEGLSRLLRAKRRARGEIDNDSNSGPQS